MNEQLTAERANLAQVLRQEFADRLAASEEETRQVKAELATLQAQQQLELEQMSRDKQAELEAVHGRWVWGNGTAGPQSHRYEEGLSWCPGTTPSSAVCFPCGG